jgi:ferredoxin
VTAQPQGRARAVVDHDLCAGVTQCLQMAPQAFGLDDAGLSVFRPGGDWTLDELREAADACPMAAIEVLAEDD